MSSIEAGSSVRHPLYPELGRGRVLEVARGVPPAARVEWPEVGQTSTHAVSVLRPEVPRGMVSARALWWDEADWASPMHLGTIDGASYITDRHALLPVARIAGLPVGWEKKLGLKPIRPQALDGMAEWLNARVVPEASGRLFSLWLINPLEQAGFRIRPLEGVKDAHGICDPDLELVGLAIPLRSDNPPTDAARSAVL